MQPQQDNNPQNQPPVTPNGQPAAPPPPPPAGGQVSPSQQQYSAAQGPQPQQPVVVGPQPQQQASTPAGPSAAPPQQSTQYQNPQQQPPVPPQQPGYQAPGTGGQPPAVQQPMQSQQQQGINQGQQFAQPQPAGPGQPPTGFSYPVEEKSGSKLKKILLLSGGALVALVSLGVGLLVAFGGASVSYDELNRAETSSSSSENISILYPVEMEEVFLGSSRLEFRHSDEDSQGMISEISTEGYFIGESFLTDEARDEIVDGLLDSSSDVYREFSDAVEEEVDRRSNFSMSDFRKIELTDGKNATTALIADMEFELPLATDRDEYVPAKGNFIYVIGQETLFAVSIHALEDVFNSNKAVFEEIAKSIEIE